MEVFVYNNANQLVAQGEVPDYDGTTTITPEEAANIRFFKVDTAGKKTSESVAYNVLVDEFGATQCESRNGAATPPSARFPISSLASPLGSPRFRSVLVSIPNRIDRSDKDLKPLEGLKGRELTFGIALPPDHDWRRIPAGVAKSILQAIDRSELSDDAKKALKQAARTGKLTIPVSLGFENTDLGAVMVQAESAPEAATTTGSGPHPAWSADAELSQINVGNLSHSTLGFMAQINAVKRRLRALIRELRAILAGGDTKMNTLIEGLEALIAKSESNKTGLVASERREQYQELAAKYRAEASQRTADAEKALAEAATLTGQAQVDKQKEGIQLREEANRLAQIASLIESLDQPLKLLEESHRSLAMDLQQDADYSRRAELQNRNNQF